MTAKTVHLAYPELRRNSREALRGAGLPLALADEAADLVAWTQAVTGAGLVWTRQGPGSLPPRIVVIREDGPRSELDAHGTSLLSMGIRIADYALARAATYGRAEIAVRRVVGESFVAYMVRRLALRGQLAAARFETIVRGAAVTDCGAAAGADAARLVRWSCSGPAREPTAKQGRLLLHCAIPAAPGGLGDITSPPTAAAVDTDCERHYTRALVEGLQVAAADYAAFVKYTSRLRAPTSERSRTQAG